MAWNLSVCQSISCWLSANTPFLLFLSPHFPLKVLLYPRICKLSGCFLPHRAISNECGTNSAVWDRFKTYFLNAQNWFLQAIFYISCQHLNATKAFSVSKQCHLENPFTLSLPAVVLHPFFVNILGNKFYLQGNNHREQIVS